MKFDVKRNRIVVTPESEHDIAFIEDTLNLIQDGAVVYLQRIDGEEGITLETCQTRQGEAQATVADISSERRIGSIKSYNDDKGYGFIVDENERDVFFHITDFAEKGVVPARGMEVSYSVGKSEHKEAAVKAINISFDSTMPKNRR